MCIFHEEQSKFDGYGNEARESILRGFHAWLELHFLVDEDFDKGKSVKDLFDAYLKGLDYEVIHSPEFNEELRSTITGVKKKHL